MNYQECVDLVAGKRGGYPDRYKLKYETWLVKEQVRGQEGDTHDEYVVQLFDNPIMRYYPDGVIQLDSCGYRTVTTKQRFNEYLGREWSVYQERSIWYVVKHTPDVTYGKAPRFTFQDGMRLYPLGFVEGAGSDPDELKALDNKIVKYVRAYVQALFDGQVPAPSGGDCWFCCMRTQDEKTLGDAFNDTEHLLSHMDEQYYVPSLLYNAMEEFPGNVSRAAKWEVGALWWPEGNNHPPGVFADVAKQQLSGVLRKYLRRRLGLAS